MGNTGTSETGACAKGEEMIASCRSFACQLAGTFLLAALAACGGGGEAAGSTPPRESAAAPAPTDIKRSVDPYVGTWQSCRSNTSVSTIERLVLVKSAADSLQFTLESTTWTQPGCLAPASVLSSQTSTGTITLAGVKNAGGEIVDKIALVHAGGLEVKQIMVLRSDDTLHLGDLSGAKDAEGYPETVSTLERFRKPY